MTWVAAAGLAVTAVGAGVSAYESSSSKSGSTAIPSSHHQLGWVPKAAPYQPVNVDQTALDTIMSNQAQLPNIEDLTRKTNSFITQQDLARINALSPGYSQNMATEARNAGALLNGQLPQSDVMSIIGNQGALSDATGIPGQAGAATLKDLGISQLQGEQTGAGLLGDMTQMAQTIAPIGSYMTPQSSMLSPEQTVPWALSQAQLEQQSLQNKYNLAAEPDPTTAAAYYAKIGQQAQQSPGGALLGAGLGSFSSTLGGLLAKSTTSGNTNNFYNNSGQSVPLSSWSGGGGAGDAATPAYL
jgi:hypothetical protein